MAGSGNDEGENSELKARLFSEVERLLDDKMKEAGISPSDFAKPERNERKAAELQERRAKRKIQISIDNTKFNCAVTGLSGVGKSSLVNALLGSRNSYAGTYQFQNSSQYVSGAEDITPYQCTHLDRLVLWDMPGAGTTDYPAETYYEDTMLEKFNAILILLGDRVFDIDIKIAKQAKNAKQDVIFVITKSDSRIKDLARKEHTNMAGTAEIFNDIVKEGFRQELERGGLKDVRIFVASSNGYSDISAYTNYTGRWGKADRSLKEMEEKKLLKFLINKGGITLDVDFETMWSQNYASESDSNVNKVPKAFLGVVCTVAVVVVVVGAIFIYRGCSQPSGLRLHGLVEEGYRPK